MHHTKTKGDIGVAKAIASLVEQGFNVALPLTEHAKYDLIIEKNGKCYTVQVRYTTPRDGVMSIRLKNSWADKNGNHIVKREKGDYDILVTYNPVLDKCYFIQDTSFNSATVLILR